MRYEFLTDTYRTEIQKVVSVWACSTTRIFRGGHTRPTHEAGACWNTWCTRV